jgi:hypothetical protein
MYSLMIDTETMTAVELKLDEIQYIEIFDSWEAIFTKLGRYLEFYSHIVIK